MSDIPFRTDLALEAREYLTTRHAREVPGVEHEQYTDGDARVTRVHVATDYAAAVMGKAPGHYITIEAQSLRQRNRMLQDQVARVLAAELERLLPADQGASIFVVGLGNWNATPDALGPRVISGLLVTRHLRGYVPPELAGRLRPVCAMAPGVLGLTGIETSEIIKGVVDTIQPDVVLCVDALAARNTGRIITTIQIADTGIQPGSGVGNARLGITRETVGRDVIAVGVPTVVHASTIAGDAMDLVLDQLRGEARFFSILDEMGQDRLALINEVVCPAFGDMMVTPKEIDVHIEDVSRVVALGLNAALHNGIGPEEMDRYLG
ncbi:MAG: GPR endopeptidase [Bacillota bacterium]